MTYITEEVVVDCTVTVLRHVDIIIVRVEDHDGEEILRLATQDASYRGFRQLLRTHGVVPKYVPFQFGMSTRINAWFTSHVRVR